MKWEEKLQNFKVNSTEFSSRTENELEKTQKSDFWRRNFYNFEGENSCRVNERKSCGCCVGHNVFKCVYFFDFHLSAKLTLFHFLFLFSDLFFNSQFHVETFRLFVWRSMRLFFGLSVHWYFMLIFVELLVFVFVAFFVKSFLWFLELRVDRILCFWKFNFPFYWIGELKVIWLCVCVPVVFSWCSKFVRIRDLIDDDCFRFFVELWDVRLMSVCLVASFLFIQMEEFVILLRRLIRFGTICFCICACWYFEIFAPRKICFPWRKNLCVICQLFSEFSLVWLSEEFDLSIVLWSIELICEEIKSKYRCVDWHFSSKAKEKPNELLISV